MGEPGDHPHEHAIMEITKQLTIYEIQYSLQTGLAQIIVGTTGHADDLEVQIHGRVSGLHTATLAKINPFVVFNKQNHSDMNKYVFEVPIDQSETYFRVSVDDSKYTLAQTVTITGQSGKVVPWYSESAESMDHLVPTEATINPAEYTVKFDGGTKVVSYNNMQFPIKYEMLGGISGLEVDEQLGLWRQRHIHMVQRTIGKRVGTGGSTGAAYLKAAADTHYVFKELAELTSFLLPRNALPKLPDTLIKNLSYQ
ncbi:MAG: hypothetical protein EB150_09045 [Nitrososphaeria archaeon]|nr:hypothetical protein [Nitrososphaeria archaeon]